MNLISKLFSRSQKAELKSKPMNLKAVILIDDDPLVHHCWKYSAEKLSLKIYTFLSEEEFLKESENLEKDLPVFIDVSLSGGVDGREVAKRISGLGFQNVFLTTGHDIPESQKPAWVKGIIGKDFPSELFKRNGS